MNKHILCAAALALAAGSALAGNNDVVFTVRNFNNTAQGPYTPAHPTTGPGLMFYDHSTLLPGYLLLGPNLSIIGGVLDASGGSAPTSGQIISALGYTPYDSSNPAGYLSSISGGQVTSALGFTPYSAANPSGFISGITGSQVSTALGYTPYSATNPAGYITGITSGQVASALGFTPYDASNPAGYVTSSSMTSTLGGYATTSSMSTALAGKMNTPTGTISQYLRGDGSAATFPTIPTVPTAVSSFANDAVYINQAGARGAISLTTTGSGAATYSSSTGVLNVPIPVTASPFNYGVINTRTFAASTAYQATDNTKAAVVKVSPSCTASLSLTAGGTCVIQARVGAPGLTCSGGTVVATWTNANTGTLTIGLGLNQTVGSPGNIELAIGEAFILCPTSGTFTIANGTDRSQG